MFSLVRLHIRICTKRIQRKKAIELIIKDKRRIEIRESEKITSKGSKEIKISRIVKNKNDKYRIKKYKRKVDRATIDIVLLISLFSFSIKIVSRKKEEFLFKSFCTSLQE